ncbi:hypothetical protein MKP08_11590 [Erythrobacter sp. LQ02-29]|nr:hypothetical protein [Erythrobacter sp. LQ02-29]MCP9223393.1 hypothetical protein [Erythrobacter sp. LQ02-29]
MAFFEGLVGKQTFNAGSFQLPLGGNNQFNIACEARHVGCNDKVHRMVVTRGQEHHPVELRPFPVRAGKARFNEDFDELDALLVTVVLQVDFLLTQRGFVLRLLARADADISECALLPRIFSDHSVHLRHVQPSFLDRTKIRLWTKQKSRASDQSYPSELIISMPAALNFSSSLRSSAIDRERRVLFATTIARTPLLSAVFTRCSSSDWPECAGPMSANTRCRCTPQEAAARVIASF